MNTLSIQRPRPSMEIATPASARAPVKAAEVNCEPWTPFCLSSGDSCGVDLSAALSDEREDLPGEVALQGSNGVEFVMPLGKSASDVVLGPVVGSQTSDGDDVQRAVGCVISAAVEPMTDGLSRRRWDWADAA